MKNSQKKKLPEHSNTNTQKGSYSFETIRKPEINIKKGQTMYKFGARSKKHYDTLHPDLQKILDEVIKIYDFSIIDGLRTSEQQQELFHKGVSQLDGINKKSKHQGDGKVSYAVDVMPYKKGSNAFSGKELDSRRFYFLMGLIAMTASDLLTKGEITHKIRFGIDWDGDDVYDDQTFHDMPHFELIEA
jgi:peptidoglycan L-alanyl-D-glutamate endopeptidase CwlK